MARRNIIGTSIVDAASHLVDRVDRLERRRPDQTPTQTVIGAAGSSSIVTYTATGEGDVTVAYPPGFTDGLWLANVIVSVLLDVVSLASATIQIELRRAITGELITASPTIEWVAAEGATMHASLPYIGAANSGLRAVVNVGRSYEAGASPDDPEITTTLEASLFGATAA